MRPEISDDVLDRLKKYIASKEYKGGFGYKAPYGFVKRGPNYRSGMTVNDALDELLTEVGF